VGTFAMVQAPQGQPAAPGGRGGGRGGVASGVFAAADTNKDGSVTREKLRAMFAKLLSDGDTAKTGALTQDQLQTAVTASLAAAMPQPAPGGGGGRGAAPQNQIPNPADVEKMKSALPDKAPAKPKRARKVLVLGKANGYVHSCIPLAAKTIETMGARTGAWATTVTYDPADINEQNLRQYDLLFLDNTTGAFLDDPNDPAATAARRKALLDFVRGGKGLAGIHAATDAYHAVGGAPPAGGRGGGMAAPLVAQMMTAGDLNHDQKLSRDELIALADAWFDKLDSAKAGRVSQQEFTTRFAALVPQPAAPARTANALPPQGRDRQIGTWPEYNKAIGGFFKFHWLDPQLITVKIDDPKSPVAAMFHGEEWDIHDETYTFGMDTWSRENLHVLTSIDYAKMSDPDKAKEDYPRSDHDYGLSWIRREGKGRVFYEAHGHSERNYAVKLMVEHVLAGAQYAIGDLKADDSPSVKPKNSR
jgi:type 1 glutamine amidotransferase/Ca2+-binding EF-hand superfamily protein